MKKGQKVRYIPPHVHKDDIYHPDCKTGVVSSSNAEYIFVLYNNVDCIMVTGDEPYTAAATRPEDLVEVIEGE